MTDTLCRLWVEYNDIPRLESVIQDFIARNISVEVLVRGVLTQYEILLTQEELTLLKLSFGYYKIVAQNNTSSSPIIVLGTDDINDYK